MRANITRSPFSTSAKPMAGRETGLAVAWSADQQDVGAFLDPTVAGADRQDMGLGDHRDDVEIEAVEGLARQQLGLDEMAREATTVAFGNLVLGECGE